MTERILAIPVEDLASVFTEWDKRWREHPEEFIDIVTQLTKMTPLSYGEACAPYFTKLALEVGNGRELEIPAP